ncbi:unnamed protein product [Prunus armeniaca]|uniref:Uncharacterized protein n=1 Tax=Prunus armeniaca TaxID=36596 RepID=A0A6J5UXI8_PRUAR|nr:unnamed protein product [Prunus armeniaca]CAB4308953.1 unnamed protein product [Prunus armeniaca]
MRQQLRPTEGQAPSADVRPHKFSPAHPCQSARVMQKVGRDQSMVCQTTPEQEKASKSTLLTHKWPQNKISIHPCRTARVQQNQTQDSILPPSNSALLKP